MQLKNTKILLVGDYPTPVYTGTLGSFKRAFDALGYKTTEFYFNLNQNLLRLAKYSDWALKILVQREQKRFLNYIFKNYISHILVFKGSYLLPETINKIKIKGITIGNYNPDNPFNSVWASSNFIIKSSIKHYDFYFTWSHEICNKINLSEKNNKAVYLPFAVDKYLIDFCPNFINPTYLYQVSFGANADKERINQIKSLLAVDENLKNNLFVFGSGWQKLKAVKSLEIKGKEYFKTISKSKINLNFLRAQNKGAHNLRTFEIPASGGFMLHEYSQEAMEFFKPDVHAVYFSGLEDCVDKIKFYLKHDVLRLKIAKSGYEQAMKYENSYEARVDVITQKFNLK